MRLDVLALVNEKLGIHTLLSYEETGLDVTFQRDLQVSRIAQAWVLIGKSSKPMAFSESAETAKVGIAAGIE